MITICIPTTKERRPRLDKCLTAIKDNSNYPHRILIYESEGQGWVKSVHDMLEGIDGWVVIMNDDMVAQKDWLKILAEKIETTDGLLYQPCDGIMNGSVATTPVAKAETIRQYLHKGYFHNFSDTEMTDKIKAIGKYIYVPESVVIHEHFTTGSPMDETYKNSQAKFEQDRDLYNSRK